MWASTVLGTLLLSAVFASMIIGYNASTVREEKLLVEHFLVREKAYSLEHEFEGVLRTSFDASLDEDEQIIVTCLAVEDWAASSNTSVSIAFEDESISVFDSVLDLVTEVGKKNMAGVLKHYTGACAMIITPVENGLEVENNGFLTDHGMSRTAFVLEREGVRVLFTEGRSVYAGTIFS